MPTNHHAAIRSQRAARDAARTVLDAEQAALIDVVLAALRAGERPIDLIEDTGWTGAYLRKLAREHEIPPPPGYASRAAAMRERQAKPKK